ncbi:MAG: hypothetical protein RIS52_1005 [Pseudomonadota bacterium]|jgi:hypothetical protein
MKNQTLVATGAVLSVIGVGQFYAVAHSAPARLNIFKVPPIARPNFDVQFWKEHGAPKCFPINQFAELMINERKSIDFTLRDGRVIRAKLKRGCTSASFYSGLYIRPNHDNMVCEDRDFVQARTGDACEIGKFKMLMPPK